MPGRIIKTLCRASLLVTLALGLYPTCNDGTKVSLSGPAVAIAKTHVDDPDPQFFAFDDSEPNQYVVVLADGSYVPPPVSGAPTKPGGGTTSLTHAETADQVASDLCDDYGATTVNTFNYAGGFSCTMDEATARTMSHDGRVVSVESDAYVYSAGKVAKGTSKGLSSAPVAWGLDRIDENNPQNPCLDGQFHGVLTGANVDVWVVDSGVWPGAKDLWSDPTNSATSRVVLEYPNSTSQIKGFTDITRKVNGKNPLYTSADDDVDHGTSVASVAGGNTVGVAPGVTIHSVKVLRSLGFGSEQDKGDISWTISGLDWVLGHLSSGKRAVVNLSLYHDQRSKKDPTGVKDKDAKSLRSVIDKLLAKNVVVVVAAGNLKQDAGNFTPSQITEVITVGATQISDQTVGSTTAFDGIADYQATYGDTTNPGSNFGSVVDVFAPGTLISTNTWSGTSMDTRTSRYFSRGYGTSFAAPFVTGVVAQYLQANPNATPDQIQSWITSNANKTSRLYQYLPSGTQNRLLYTNL